MTDPQSLASTFSAAISAYQLGPTPLLLLARDSASDQFILINCNHIPDILAYAEHPSIQPIGLLDIPAIEHLTTYDDPDIVAAAILQAVADRSDPTDLLILTQIIPLTSAPDVSSPQ